MVETGEGTLKQLTRVRGKGTARCRFPPMRGRGGPAIDQLEALSTIFEMELRDLKLPHHGAKLMSLEKRRDYSTGAVRETP